MGPPRYFTNPGVTFLSSGCERERLHCRGRKGKNVPSELWEGEKERDKDKTPWTPLLNIALEVLVGALTKAGEKQKEMKGRKTGSKKLKHICR